MSVQDVWDVAARLWQASPWEVVAGLLSSSVVCAVVAVVAAWAASRLLARRGAAVPTGVGRSEGVALGIVALAVGAAWFVDVVLRGYVFDMSATVSWWRFALAPMVAAAGLVIVGLSLRVGETRRAVDAASITRRTWTTFGPRRGILALVTVAAITMAVIVVFGAMSTAVDPGLAAHLALTAPNTDALPVIMPFPGWAYGIPALLAVAALVGASAFALHRNAVRPFSASVPLEREREARTRVAREVVAVALACLLVTLAGVLRMARRAAATSYTTLSETGRGARVNVRLPHEDLILVGGLAAPLLEIAGCVVLALLVIGAVRRARPGYRRVTASAGVTA